MRRLLLVGAAALFFAWQNVATFQWLHAHGGVAPGLRHAWAALLDDRLVLLVFLDAGVFTLCALVWLWGDLRRRLTSTSRRALWFGATVLVGSPVFLLYLASRPREDR